MGRWIQDSVISWVKVPMKHLLNRALSGARRPNRIHTEELLFGRVVFVFWCFWSSVDLLLLGGLSSLICAQSVSNIHQMESLPSESYRFPPDHGPISETALTGC